MQTENNTPIQWACIKFEDLHAEELYAILQLRSKVFVVEQNCVYLDMDDKDQQCFHFCGWHGNELAAYVRIVPPGVAFDEVSIGRVVTNSKYRKGGLGRMLMTKAIDTCVKIFYDQPIKIGAQLYLKKFYESLGFIQCSDMYLEDDIEHIKMLLNPKSKR